MSVILDLGLGLNVGGSRKAPYLTSCSILNKLKETGLMYEKSTFYSKVFVKKPGF
ncbi:hypothetical protein DSM106972_064960 [Dulcicalothrix desertica PCC 7102]|uniref:Uncharacterized protein n=1 Tax=Dulcicalothrix desertica PCC 7102 TaxID=232991 RepID=A0A433V6Z3_9CYAN|nr:hypothetical protein [Dulcicalothrix desertica]RUT01873.1 hypothetical protein DSM106972_064960 [Dulcicalothrix desertica PCC 7102]TWH43026.1 hypothetical protein CAL7102_06718 [Dulcicalothrix desertica PCC 7102]